MRSLTLARIVRVFAVLALALLLPLGASADVPVAPKPQPVPVAAPAVDAAEDTGTQKSAFEAADPSKLKENLEPIPFLVAAYLVIWAALFGYIVIVHRRAVKLEREVLALRADIERVSALAKKAT